METNLTNREIEILLESLRYTIEAFEKYPSYPNDNFRKQAIQEIEDLKIKLKSMKS